MSRTRLTLLGIALVVAAGFGLLAHLVTNRAETPVLQGTEEVMVDATMLLRAEVEAELAAGRDPAARLDARWSRALAASPEGSRETAQIFDREKTKLSLYAAWYDADGVLLWSSYPGLAPDLGQSLRQRQDVFRALDGRYGARSSRLHDQAPDTSVLFTTLPTYRDGEIVGAVSVIKEQREVNSFIHSLMGRLLLAVGLIGIGMTVFIIAVAVWLLRPMARLTDWARRVEAGERVALPRLGSGRRALALGRELENMRSALDGRREIAAYARQVTHELKSPLTGIRAAAELLAEPTLPPPRRERLTRALEHEVERSERVLEALHGLARLEEREALGEPRPVDLARLGPACLERRRERARLRGVDLSWTGPDDSALVSGEAVLLEGAVDNLVENAIDFAPPGSVVEVDLTPSEGGWQLRLRDRGPGIPDYALKRVFERFYSLRSDAQGGKGSGLGLNLVQQTAHLHGGRVELINRNGGGAEAILWLPAITIKPAS